MKSFICDASWSFFLPVSGFDSQCLDHKTSCIVSTKICSTLGTGNSPRSLGLSMAKCCWTSTGIQNGNGCAVVVMKAYISLYAFWKRLLFGTRTYCDWREMFGYDPAGTLRTSIRPLCCRCSMMLVSWILNCREIGAPTIFILSVEENQASKQTKAKETSRLFLGPTPDWA